MEPSDIGTLRARRLGLADGVHEGAHDSRPGCSSKARLADTGMHDARLLARNSTSPPFAAAPRSRHPASPYQASGSASDRAAPEPCPAADDGHHVGGRDTAVEIHLAALNRSARSSAPTISAPASCAFGLVALGEHRNPHRLAGSVRQLHNTAHLLIGMARVNAQIHRNFDGLVEFDLAFPYELRPLPRRG